MSRTYKRVSEGRDHARYRKSPRVERVAARPKCRLERNSRTKGPDQQGSSLFDARLLMGNGDDSLRRGRRGTVFIAHDRQRRPRPDYLLRRHERQPQRGALLKYALLCSNNGDPGQRGGRWAVLVRHDGVRWPRSRELSRRHEWPTQSRALLERSLPAFCEKSLTICARRDRSPVGVAHVLVEHAAL